MIEAHNLTRLPAAPWCEICVQARGKKRPAHGSQVRWRNYVQMDFHFTSGVAVWSPEAHAKGTVLTIVHMDTGYVGVLVSGKHPNNFMGWSTASFVDKSRAAKTRLRFESEPAMRHLAKKFAASRHPRSTILEPINRAEHQSVGRVDEEHIRASKLPHEHRGQTSARGLEKTMCLDTHPSSGCCGMQRGHTLDSSLKVVEAELLEKSAQPRATKVFCFLS